MTNLIRVNTLSLSLCVCLAELYLWAPEKGLTGQPLFSRSLLPAWQTIKATHVPGRYTGDMMFWEASFSSRFRQTRTLCSVSVKTSDGRPGICFQLLSLRRPSWLMVMWRYTSTQPAPEEKKTRCGVSMKDQFVDTLGRHCPAVTSWISSSQFAPSKMMKSVILIHYIKEGASF